LKLYRARIFGYSYEAVNPLADSLPGFHPAAPTSRNRAATGRGIEREWWSSGAGGVSTCTPRCALPLALASHLLVAATMTQTHAFILIHSSVHSFALACCCAAPKFQGLVTSSQPVREQSACICYRLSLCSALLMVYEYLAPACRRGSVFTRPWSIGRHSRNETSATCCVVFTSLAHTAGRPSGTPMTCHQDLPREAASSDRG
jgi:hypothetical protein